MQIRLFSHGMLNIYTEKPEIPFGKSYGSRHSIWNVCKLVATGCLFPSVFRVNFGHFWTKKNVYA